MIYLAVDQATSILFAGAAEPFCPLPPGAAITSCAHIPQDEEPGGHVPHSSTFDFKVWTFLEHSFDPLTRIRRGRLWQAFPGGQPDSRQVAPSSEQLLASGNVGGRVRRPVYVYKPARDLFSLPRRGLGVTLALGTRDAFTLWRVVHVELVQDDAIMVTLKARSALGALPDLSLDNVDDEFKESITVNYSIALESAHRESPGSVVDRAKDTLAVMLSRWLVQDGASRDLLTWDIGKLVDFLEKSRPGQLICVKRLGDVLAKLHARNKPNEQHKRGLSGARESDAELAIQALGFAMRELGLAEDSSN